MQTGTSSGGSAREATDQSQSAAERVEAASQQPVTTRIELPPRDWGFPLLTITGDWPPSVTAGTPFALQLLALNNTGHVMDLDIRLGDTAGFVLTGASQSSQTAPSYLTGDMEQCTLGYD